MITLKKHDNKSKLLFTDADRLIYEIKTEDVYKEMCGLSNYSTKSKYYDDSNKFVIGKMKDETGGVKWRIVGLKLKMYSVLEDDNNEHEKAKGVHRNVVATISHSEYKDVLLNNKSLRHSMNRIQSKDHRIGFYEINKISLSCFYDKIYIKSNG